MRKISVAITAICCAVCVLSTPISYTRDLPGCDIFHENSCQGDEIDTPAHFEDHRWFTPAKGEQDYLPSFQDYSRLVAHSHLVYSPDRQSAEASIIALHKDSSVKIEFAFDGIKQSENAKSFAAGKSTSPVQVDVYGDDGSHIHLEDIDFLWNAPAVNNAQGDYRQGQKGAIVEVFGWPHHDIEEECADLARYGYLGVKVFPAMEQVMSTQPFNNILNPWYFMYQPVSYRLAGRMGTRDDLRRMIYACRKLGVRVYADAVVNHMVGGGNDANPHHRNSNGACTNWGAKDSSMINGSSPFYTQNFVYQTNAQTGQPPSQEFPAVPYGPTDFHCERALNSWTSPQNLNAGWLSGLTDLNTEKENVRERIADYMTDLLSIGFSGFRVDAAKHIRPDDLAAIFGKVSRNMGGSMPGDFISWLEILLGGEADLLMCNPNSGYNYGSYLEKALASAGVSSTDIDKIKVWNSGYPKEPEKGTCTISRQRSVIQNDDADQQMPGSSSRDMGDQGCVLIKNCDDNTHRGFEVKLFQSPNGASDNDNDYPIRLVLSSFYFPNNSAMGIPDGKSDCSLCTKDCQSCQGVSYHVAHDGSSRGYDKESYTRVHRDAAIVSAMRKWMHLN